MSWFLASLSMSGCVGQCVCECDGIPCRCVHTNIELQSATHGRETLSVCVSKYDEDVMTQNGSDV